jgi:hypothetical protein
MSMQTLVSRNTRPLSSDTRLESQDGTAPSPEWPAAQLTYMRWLAMPAFARNPHSEAALAGDLGCSVMTLRLWRLRPAFRRQAARMAATFQSSDLADLLTSIETQAAKGSAKHAHLYHDLIDLVRSNAEQPAGTAVLVGLNFGDS